MANTVKRWNGWSYETVERPPAKRVVQMEAACVRRPVRRMLVMPRGVRTVELKDWSRPA